MKTFTAPGSASREPLLPSPLTQGSDLRDPTFLLTIPLAGWALGPSKPPLRNLDTALGAPEGRGNKRTKVNGSTQSLPLPDWGLLKCTHTPFTPRELLPSHTHKPPSLQGTHAHNTHTPSSLQGTHTHPSFQRKHTHTHPSLQGNSRPHSQPLFLKPLF